MKVTMTLEFKKVIREIFEREVHNSTSDKDSVVVKEEISQKETECKVEPVGVVSSKKLYNRSAVWKGNLSNNSRPCIVSSNCNNEQVPEWDKVFKNILGNNKAKYDITTSQKHDVCPTQECTSSPQKCENEVKSRCPIKNASKNMEEEKVRELFANSRSFKLNDPFQHNLSEYEGLGVNIFKSCDNKASAVLPRKSSQSLACVKPMNNSYHCSLKPFEPYTPLTGFIAVKPYLKNNMEHSDCIPVTEAWDEDFYF